MTERSFGLATKEDFIEHLLYGRDQFSEEIPSRILHSTDGNFKIRTGWFVGIASALWEVREHSILPDPIIEDVNIFLNWYSGEFKDREGDPPLNTREDIEKGNEIIDKVLASYGVKPKEIKK